MPHSSGGGSGGSGSSGGSGGSGSRRFGSDYYRGSHRYVYYNNLTRNLAYYFSDREYTKKDAESRKRGQWFSAVVFIFFGLISLITYALSRNDKITTDYDTAIVIQDDAQVLSGDDQSGLERSFAGFLEKTGITPAFLSVDYKDWSDRYPSLEQYAYEAYLDRFEDEKHWLVVYSPDRESDCWYWHGMIGDDCGRVISSSLEQEFTKAVQSELEDSSSDTVAGAISSAFDKIGSRAKGGDAPLLGGGLLMLLCSLFPLKDALKKIPEDDPRYQSYLCETDKEKPLEAQCAHCGGMYVQGLHDRCPYCGEPVESG